MIRPHAQDESIHALHAKARARMLMLDLMYDLPSRKDVTSFTVTRELVEQRSKAQVLPLGGTLEEAQQASA